LIIRKLTTQQTGDKIRCARAEQQKAGRKKSPTCLCIVVPFLCTICFPNTT